MAAIKSDKNLQAAAVSITIPVISYIAILLIPTPASFSRLFAFYSILLFILTLCLYWLAFQLQGSYRWLASASLTMLLLGLRISFLWHSGYSDDKIIGGLIPFRDAFDYYNGAKLLLSGEPIKTINEGASWRPLYPGFLSALLWITGQNLQWALAIQVGLAGLCYSLSAEYVRSRLGPVASALYMTLLFFYIQPLIGTAYTETFGLAMGCLGFVLLWSAARTQKLSELLTGVIVLMIAVSARAGAFLIFPVLVVWAGWAFGPQPPALSHREKAVQMGATLAATVAAYLIVNTIFSKLVVEPGGFPFGNFAFTIYGQVSGGAGYHKAFEDLGVRNPGVILQAAERFFLAHPLGFVIGAVKAYRDFFSPRWGAFNFGPGGVDIVLAVAGSLLLLPGVYYLARKATAPESALLLAGFIGVLLSIPFLPPIDGGIRIYASTMPFIYVLPAAGVSKLARSTQDDEPGMSVVRPAWLLSILLGALTVIVPVLVLHLGINMSGMKGSCGSDEVGYGVVASAGSFIDLVPPGGDSCGSLPEVCLADFEHYSKGNDPSDAQVFAELGSRATTSVIRVFAANDLVSGRPHLFVSEPLGSVMPNNAIITGCATETLIKGRPSIYDIKFISDAILIPMR